MSEGNNNPKKVSFRNITGTFKSFSTEVSKVTKTLQLKPLSSNKNNTSKDNDDVVLFDDIHKPKFSISFHNNPMKRDSELSVWSGTKGYDDDGGDDDDDDGDDNNNNNVEIDDADKNKKAKENEDQDTEVDTSAGKNIQESSDLYEKDDEKELESLFRILDSEGIFEGVRILEESEESVSKKSFLNIKHLTEFKHENHALKITRNLTYIRDRRCDECKVNCYHCSRCHYHL